MTTGDRLKLLRPMVKGLRRAETRRGQCGGQGFTGLVVVVPRCYLCGGQSRVGMSIRSVDDGIVVAMIAVMMVDRPSFPR